MRHRHTVPSSGASPRTIAQMGRGKPLYGPFFCQWGPQPRSTGNGSRGQGSGLCPLAQGPRWSLSTRTPRRMAGVPHPIFRSRFGGALAREGVVGPSRPDHRRLFGRAHTVFCIGGWSLSGLTFLPLCPAPMYIDPLRGALSKTHKTALTSGGAVCMCVWGGGVVLVVGFPHDDCRQSATPPPRPLTPDGPALRTSHRSACALRMGQCRPSALGPPPPPLLVGEAMDCGLWHLAGHMAVRGCHKG